VKGSSLLGKTISPYKIIEKIGQGGMGAIYRVEDASMKREVATP
jgi:serine/threonine protein kinase